jgi:hypothetical protein
MLHDVVLHLNNEQPLMADLLHEPGAKDVCLICTNLRLMNGKVPIFVDDGKSTFLFPMSIIRFIEIKPGTVRDQEPDTAEPEPEAEPEPRRVSPARRLHGGTKAARPAGEKVEEPAVDDYPMPPLQRLAWVSGAADEPPVEAVAAPAPVRAEEAGEDPDELLRRVREV